MKRFQGRLGRFDKGFTLVEVLIAMFLTVVIMGAVFGLLQRGQRGFQREPEISELNQNARVGVDSRHD
jgi:prepilin-type N-terminal cleavage/methylation domain-containing protein